MRVAIVHDKLVQMGGAERVARRMLRLWPHADFYTSAFDPELAAREGFGDVHATFLQRLPARAEQTRWMLPLYDRAFRSLDLGGYDLLVSSAAMFAKSAHSPTAPHVCYCHTPVVYLWHLRDSHFRELPYRAGVRLAASATVPWLRRADRRAAAAVDVFVANSNAVAERIRRYYGRESLVVHPPVDVSAFAADPPADDYFVVVARLYPYKRVDLAIEACAQVGVRLKVLGDGGDRKRLEALAGETVEFLGWVDDDRKAEVIGAARALLAPQLEDFGIAMVEALAAGTPVIALQAGGALDIIDDGETGLLFAEQTTASLVEAIRRLDSASLDPALLRERAARFVPERFDAAMRDVAARALSGYRSA